jgi:MFS family permease
MFAFSKRWGALADRYGPRWFMAAGPVIQGIGILLMLRVTADGDYWTEILPALVVFGIGLSLTVAPLTAAVLAAVDDSRSGIASGVNNAVSRVAGLLAIAILGTFISAQFTAALDDKVEPPPLSPAGVSAVADAKDRPLAVARPNNVPAPERARIETATRDASVDSFHLGMGISAVIVIAGGLIAAVGVENPRRKTHAETSPAGAICGAPECVGEPERGEPAAVGA